MDLAAILERGPDVALIDELAHTNAPGSLNAKRWHDVDALLNAGIDVVTTVNVQHLESLNDVVFDITGVRQRETVPDEVVRAAQAAKDAGATRAAPTPVPSLGALGLVSLASLMAVLGMRRTRKPTERRA